MTRRSKNYFKYTKLVQELIDCPGWRTKLPADSFLDKIPIPGSADMSRLEDMPYLKSLGEKIETMGPDDQGRYMWKVPNIEKYPYIVSIDPITSKEDNNK